MVNRAARAQRALSVVPQTTTSAYLDDLTNTARKVEGRVGVAADLTIPDIDWDLVRQLRSKAAERLAEELSAPDDDTAAGLDVLTSDTAKARAWPVINALLAEHTATIVQQGVELTPESHDRLIATAVHDSLFRLGRLQPVVDHPLVENVEVYGSGQACRIEMTGGELVDGPVVADTDDELVDWIRFMASRMGRVISPTRPRVHLRLPGGERMVAQIPPLAAHPQMMIRKHRIIETDLDESVRLGVMDPPLSRFLRAAVRASLSIIVIGPQGCGKTLLLRALAAALPPDEAIATIEDEFELFLHEIPHHRRVFPHEAIPGSGEIGPDGRPIGQITMADILPDTLRENRAVVVVGEARDHSILAMFDAMAAGAGSMSTVHARNAVDAINRMSLMIARGGAQYSLEFARETIATNVDLIVHIKVLKDRDPDGTVHRTRFISEVVHVQAGGDRGYQITSVYRATGPDGRAQPGVMPWAIDEALAGEGFDRATDFDAHGGSTGSRADDGGAA